MKPLFIDVDQPVDVYVVTALPDGINDPFADDSEIIDPLAGINQLAG